MINFSIIIPHKNIPDLLLRCLDSIPRRKDVQIIVVDDNSDDDKIDFANFPGLNDPFVEVILGKNENRRKGAGYARNLGLERAKGKWLLFADADDFFVKGAFESMSIHINSPYEIIYFKSESRNSDTFESANRYKPYNQLIDNFNNGNIDSEDLLRYRYVVPWSKMIKRDFVIRNEIKFDEVIASNDVIFSLLTGYYAKSVTTSNQIIYCITEREGSLTRFSNEHRLTSRYIVYLRYNHFLRKHEKGQYQYPIFMWFLLPALKRYDCRMLVKYIRLAFLYKDNPFRGMCKFILTKLNMINNYL